MSDEKFQEKFIKFLEKRLENVYPNFVMTDTSRIAAEEVISAMFDYDKRIRLSKALVELDELFKDAPTVKFRSFYEAF